MIATTITACALLVWVAIPFTAFAQDSTPAEEVQYPAPTRFEDDILRFEAEDAKAPPPAGGIVCIGSSSMRGWHESIREDLAPLSVIPRGFGGSTMYDALFYAGRIVLPYKPRAVVLYEGDNDVDMGISPEVIEGTFREFVERVHGELPECRIYFLSIKPSIARWHWWPVMVEANRLIAADCAGDPLLTYVDVAAGMLNEKGEPRPEIFLDDNLHMNRKGYVIWRDILRPILLEGELQYEAPVPAESNEGAAQPVN